MRKFKAKVLRLASNSFVRSAGTLVSGTAAAQALTILALPLLTRLYSPEDFSLLAVYVAILAVISVVACLRLEIAIPLPKGDVDAVNLLVMALASVGIISILVAAIVVMFGDLLFEVIGKPEMISYGWLLPVGIWLAGSYGALQFWATRKKRFSIIARTRMMQAGSGLTAQLGLGLILAGPIGLLLGHALMVGAGVVELIRDFLKKERSYLSSVSGVNMLQVLTTYKRFPQYSTLEALANNAAIHIPIILIAALSIGPEAGFVLIATRALGTPVTLVGNAVAQVYLSQAPDELRGNRLPEFTSGVLISLAKFGVAPIIFIAIVSPSLFALAFGEEWRRAGDLVAWMAPWFIMKLLASPISMVMHVRMMQTVMLGLMVAGLLIRIVLTLGAYKLNPEYIVEGYALSGVCFYLIAFGTYAFAAEVGWRTIFRMIGSAVLPSVVAIALAVLVSPLLE